HCRSARHGRHGKGAHGHARHEPYRRTFHARNDGVANARCVRRTASGEIRHPPASGTGSPRHRGGGIMDALRDPRKILVIKLGALGDFVQALGPVAAIRRHHPHAHITLMTTKPFLELAQASGYFDVIWIDEKPKWHQAGKWLSLRNHLNDLAFDRVYDLQNNDRTGLYFRLLKSPKP